MLPPGKKLKAIIQRNLHDSGLIQRPDVLAEISSNGLVSDDESRVIQNINRFETKVDPLPFSNQELLLNP